MYATRVRARGFSLIELVIVVVIIGIIAAIAIPRMSRGSAGAQDSTLSANLRVLRNAIELFSSEHGSVFPLAATFSAQMTTYTDASGAAQASKDSSHIYGPYLRTIPALPVGTTRKGSIGVAAADAANIGWIYTEADGNIKANTTTEADATGKAYNTY